MKDFAVSRNFWLSELIVSQTAARHRIDNIPDAATIANLKLLAERILQPVRDRYGLPVVVTSGYRSLEVNRRIGSKDSSQHRTGQAVDFTVPGVDNFQVATWIRDNLSFDQLILEFWTGGNTGWVHCSYSSLNRKQTLTINRYGTSNGFRLSR